MKPILTILIGFLLVGCSCDETDTDLQFTKRHKALYKSYAPRDTIYFVSNKNDWDTLLIAAVDSFMDCGGLMVARSKRVVVESTHLPHNRWNGGFVDRNGKSVKLSQRLIDIDKQPKEEYENYSISVNYRNFMGEISNITATRRDSLLQDLGIDQYWEINNDVLEWPQYKQDSATITKIYWTEQFGLTSYLKKNGEYYKIKNVP